MISMTDNMFKKTVQDIVLLGRKVETRGRVTLEKLASQTTIPMSAPVLTLPERKLGYRFMAAEAAWILSGDNRVKTIAPYSKQISQFSDDGEFFFGAYGVKFVDQVSYIVETLANDQGSRQAYMNIWREQPRKTKDVPCTTGLQWIIRNNAIHCIATMRSSDMFLGWPYDVFNFSMMSLAILLLLRDKHGINLGLGQLVINAGSQHIYVDDLEKLKDVSTFMTQSYEHVYPEEFESFEYLSNRLWMIAKYGDAKKILLNGLKGINTHV